MAKRQSAADKKALVKANAGAVALADGYGDSAGDGFQNVSQDDLQIPFLTVLQSNSPQVKPVDKGGLGLELGMLYNTVTQDHFDGSVGIGLVPAVTAHEWVEWADRDAGGGFIARHKPEDQLVIDAKSSQAFGQYKNGSNHLVETFYIYGVMFDLETNESLGTVCVSFSSTKIKSYKRCMTALSQFQLKIPQENGQTRKITPPLFAHTLRVTAVDDKNSQGEFQNLVLSAANGSIRESLIAQDDDRFQDAMDLKDSILKGRASAAYGSAETAGDGDDDSDNAPF